MLWVLLTPGKNEFEMARGLRYLYLELKGGPRRGDGGAEGWVSSEDAGAAAEHRCAAPGIHWITHFEKLLTSSFVTVNRLITAGNHSAVSEDCPPTHASLKECGLWKCFCKNNCYT